MLRLLPLGVALTLSACAGGGRLAYGPGRTDYPHPGPPGDPWRPYIRAASRHFSVPQRWIRVVMQRESGGHEYRRGRAIRSAAGAMGLMQLMPATYADMQAQNGLGGDPYQPHDNIFAGTAYIRLLYGRYGAPGFLAAYNAGPQRLDDYLNTGRRLPNETADYVAALGPRLDAAPVRVVAATPVRLAAWRVPLAPAPAGGWAIQVGAYSSAAQAHFAATMARGAASAPLAASRNLIEPTSRFGGTVLYRARLAGLARADASAACDILARQAIACIIVSPGG